MLDRIAMRYPSAAPHDPAVDAWLEERQRAQPELGALARAWCAHLRACGDDVCELMHDGQATACVGDAPFAYVGVFSAHVNVGFFHGASLADPARVLEGSGKFMRHVKLRPAHVHSDAVRALVNAAYVDVRARLAALPPE
ncbi:MAG TPA: DUF1801 domain-containing protein [Myxococcota bacterium]